MRERTEGRSAEGAVMQRQAWGQWALSPVKGEKTGGEVRGQSTIV